MTLTDEDIREFSEIWKTVFRESLSAAEARQHASALIELYLILAGHADGSAHGGLQEPSTIPSQ